MEKVLIIGNGYAGLQAARTLSAQKRFAVTLVSAEESPAYCPHLLPGLAAGWVSASDLFLSDRSDYERMGIAFRPGVEVARIDAAGKKAYLATGETAEFDKALVATGSRAYVPESLEAIRARCANVLAMKRLPDALALRGFLARGASDIVVVGAGRIGVLLAEALRDRGVRVSLVEIGPEILATMLQGDVAARLRPVLADRGDVSLHTGCRIEDAAIDGGAVRRLALSDGTEIPCDVVVLATGVEPNVGFLPDGIAGPDGIAVDARMETRAPGIFAAGDVVVFETITGRTDVRPLVQNARVQGEAAALNIAGRSAACPPSYSGNIVKFDSTVAARIGDIEGDGHADFSLGKSFARATFSGGTVIGLQMIGDALDLRGLSAAVEKKFRADDIRPLLGGHLESGFAPLLASRSLRWA